MAEYLLTYHQWSPTAHSWFARTPDGEKAAEFRLNTYSDDWTGSVEFHSATPHAHHDASKKPRPECFILRQPCYHDGGCSIADDARRWMRSEWLQTKEGALDHEYAYSFAESCLRRFLRDEADARNEKENPNG
jgi:hypothetical protein